MDFLTVTQIVFNIVVTLAILVISLLVCVIAFEVIMFINMLKRVGRNVKQEGIQLKNKLEALAQMASQFSWVANIFKKKKSAKKED